MVVNCFLNDMWGTVRHLDSLTINMHENFELSLQRSAQPSEGKLPAKRTLKARPILPTYAVWFAVKEGDRWCVEVALSVMKHRSLVTLQAHAALILSVTKRLTIYAFSLCHCSIWGAFNALAPLIVGFAQRATFYQSALSVHIDRALFAHFTKTLSRVNTASCDDWVTGILITTRILSIVWKWASTILHFGSGETAKALAWWKKFLA